MQTTAKQMRNIGNRQAQRRRDMARATARKRKEEYLGARVPKELRDKVIAKANRLDIPVSILIRNILEQAFDGSEDSTAKPNTEHATVTLSPRDNTNKAVNNRFSTVIGWEQITLNKTMSCSACDKRLNPGAEATLGLAGPGDDHVILCSDCKVFA